MWIYIWAHIHQALLSKLSFTLPCYSGYWFWPGESAFILLLVILDYAGYRIACVGQMTKTNVLCLSMALVSHSLSTPGPRHSLIVLINLLLSVSYKPLAMLLHVVPVCTGQPFNFVPLSVQEVHEVLKALDPRETSGPDFTFWNWQLILLQSLLQWKIRKYQGYRNLLLIFFYLNGVTQLFWKLCASI